MNTNTRPRGRVAFFVALCPNRWDIRTHKDARDGGIAGGQRDHLNH